MVTVQKNYIGTEYTFVNLIKGNTYKLRYKVINDAGSSP